MSAKKDMLAVNRIIDQIASVKKQQLAVFSIYGMTRERIFVDGIAADGSAIGTYSTKPLYANPRRIAGTSFSPRGKTGKTKFENGKSHVTRYFPKGYRELRQTAGRQSARVDLRFSGTLRSAWLPGRQGNAWVIGFSDQVNADKGAGNEDHFKKQIFALTEREIDTLINKLA
jgi:hypothetical protein